ncbi:permease component of an ABC superfamily transporter [Lacticaseibacillus paracasei]|nr:permease component of an ABC superfamily transporter [Lacticaseibacillus paracasei]
MKPLTKNLWRNIRDSLGRFIAIVIIIMLGVLLFVGVKATGPALKDSLNTTVKADHLADSQLLATTGVSKAQVKAAESVSGVQAEAVKFKYVIGGRASDVVALYGYQKGTTINRLHLTSGQLPTQANQIVLDTAAKKAAINLVKLTPSPAAASLLDVLLKLAVLLIRQPTSKTLVVGQRISVMAPCVILPTSQQVR